MKNVSEFTDLLIPHLIYTGCTESGAITKRFMIVKNVKGVQSMDSVI